ncbi:unnamed protein product [Rotaria sp. Silwood2]|nr:unnamed protein product [Rotaria sp. Silwood2]CAF3133541.1 unnamed protein product [Rotaria sp. Silwood2]CAF3481356.1 unnamed protein product [Rotaria sp. Silwood2]CAF4081668.1 unnamed protein product [Rotaria sp. Silwood2]CAF4231772.1 unnamed protein product [Rotaria sp. Silwood2]
MNSNNNLDLSSKDGKTYHPTIKQHHIEEFVPTSNDDSLLIELRRVFISAFYEYYKTIEPQLNLPTGETLLNWLETAFNEEVNELLSHQCRCFVIYTPPPSSVVAGFLTIKESKIDSNGIYISQYAVDPVFKRQGYGLCLLKYLSTVFPSATSYTCLCRRLNKPALKFYERCGATFIDEDQLVTMYGYSPTDYIGLQFSSSQLKSL